MAHNFLRDAERRSDVGHVRRRRVGLDGELLEGVTGLCHDDRGALRPESLISFTCATGGAGSVDPTFVGVGGAGALVPDDAAVEAEVLATIGVDSMAR